MEREQREAWTSRINIAPSVREAIRLIARTERMPVATVIGMALAAYVTPRSSAA